MCISYEPTPSYVVRDITCFATNIHVRCCLEKHEKKLKHNNKTEMFYPEAILGLEL